MPSPFLYSTNPLIKYEIYRDYYEHIHFVWCADCFDSRSATSHHRGANLPPSSNPAEIYASLRAATVDRPDMHNKDIRDWRASIKSQAIRDRAQGRLSDQDEQDIVYLLDHSDLGRWRPLLYVINRAAIENARLQEVPAAERANPSAVEYRIVDLQPAEFDVIGL